MGSERKRFSEMDFSGRERSFFVIDIDGTIAIDGTDSVDGETRVALGKVGNRHDARLASNGKDGARNARIAETAGIRYAEGRKPFRKLAEDLRKENRERLPFVVVGDRFLTDGLLALRLGGEFIPVRPLRGRHEPFRTRLAYGTHNFATALFLWITGESRRP